MDVTITKYKGEKEDDREALEIEIDGICVFRVADGEPENATLSRDFQDCGDIGSLMEKAYKAGKNGMKFHIETRTIIMECKYRKDKVTVK